MSYEKFPFGKQFEVAIKMLSELRFPLVITEPDYAGRFLTKLNCTYSAVG